MFQTARDWNPKQAKLKEIILKPECFIQAKQLCLEMHSIVHSREVSNREKGSFFDEIWQDLSRTAVVTMPTVKDVTIAWNIWHITRIEDIVSNILIGDSEQILDDIWLKRLNTEIRDTANAMTDEEIIAFSESVDMDQLRNYRNAVGKRTAEVIEGLSFADMKRKAAARNLERILTEGGVTEHKDSIWLLDFWSRKNIAGLMLMPITRHQVHHLNNCMKLKTKIMGRI